MFEEHQKLNYSIRAGFTGNASRISSLYNNGRCVVAYTQGRHEWRFRCETGRRRCASDYAVRRCSGLLGDGSSPEPEMRRKLPNRKATFPQTTELTRSSAEGHRRILGERNSGHLCTLVGIKSPSILSTRNTERTSGTKRMELEPSLSSRHARRNKTAVQPYLFH